jgi:hypothetical protein
MHKAEKNIRQPGKAGNQGKLTGRRSKKPGEDENLNAANLGKENYDKRKLSVMKVKAARQE